MSEENTQNSVLSKRQKYRKWISTSVGIGVAGFFIANTLWLFTEMDSALYAGLAIYWLGCLGMGVGYIKTPVSISDELEEHMIRDANNITTVFILIVTILGLPADVVLSATGLYTVPAEVRGLLWGYMLLILVFVASNWYVERQY